MTQHLVTDPAGVNELLVLEPETDSVCGNILFFHGHQVGTRTGGWETPRYLLPLLVQGYRIFVPSILGYGGTTGEPDYCGPNTMQRIFNTMQGFITETPHIIGASRGGTLAILFSEYFPELTRSCTAISGVYDLELLLAQTNDEKLKQNILIETGGTSDAYRKRNPKILWQKMSAPLHLIHGAKDDQIPVSQAELFGTFLRSKGLSPTVTIIENAGHRLFSDNFFKKTVIPFMESVQ